MSSRSRRSPTVRCGASRSRRPRRRARAGDRARARCGVVSRLGRRIGLARGRRSRAMACATSAPRSAGPMGTAPGMRPWSAAGGVARRGAGVRAAAARARGTRRAGQGQLRPAPHPQSRPHGRAELIPMQTDFTAAQLADPDTAQSEKILRDLRPLRVLHRDLPDLSAARRRARQPARPHLPDQGHAGARRAPSAETRQAYRPLPLVPRLHDDLPVGRQLHASGRSRPALHRGDITAARWPSGCCAGCSARC